MTAAESLLEFADAWMMPRLHHRTCWKELEFLWRAICP